MEVKFVKHGECTEDLLNKIGTLKMQHWNYSVIEHLKWFDDNINTDDIHLCVLENDKLIAYTTILNIEYHLEEEISKSAFGVGSVCVDKDNLNKQFGFLIIQLATFYIRQQSSIGFLICKDELVTFYEKCNWIKFNAKFIIANTTNHCNLLCTINISESKQIAINKSF